MQWMESACFAYFSKKGEWELKSKKVAMISDWKLAWQTGGGQRGRGVWSLFCYEDSKEVADHLWDHPFCFVFHNPFLSLSLNLQTY